MKSIHIDRQLLFGGDKINLKPIVKANICLSLNISFQSKLYITSDIITNDVSLSEINPHMIFSRKRTLHLS